MSVTTADTIMLQCENLSVLVVGYHGRRNEFPSAAKIELSEILSFKPGVGPENSSKCFSYCQEFYSSFSFLFRVLF